jgi:hypothetical protein
VLRGDLDGVGDLAEAREDCFRVSSLRLRLRADGSAFRVGV